MKTKFLILVLAISGLTIQAQSKYGASPEDSLNCLKNLSLFNEFYKQDNFKDAYKPWATLIEICPKATKNLYIKGAKMVEQMIDDEAIAKRKEGLIDTLLLTYDMRIEHFGQEGYVLGRKSADLLKYKSAQPELAFDAASKSIELQGNRSEPSTLQTYYLSLNLLVKKGEKAESMMISEFPKLMDIVKANIDGKYGKYYEQVEGALKDIFTPYATCEALIGLYEDKFRANPNDTVIQKDILKFFEMRDCTDEQLFMDAAKAYDKVNPSATSKLNIGIGLLKKSNYTEAIDYLKEGVEMTDEQDKLITGYKYLSYASLRAKRYASVKTYAYKWAQLDEGNGEPYKLMGDAYFYGSKTCGENSCDKAFGYIAAVGKYVKAKSLSPELASDCDKMIGQAQANYPKKEDCFFHGITDGSSESTGCWINETITVKTRP